MDYQRIIDKYYPAGRRLRDIYMHHASQVTDLALDIAERKHLPLDRDDIIAAAMLHDIGIVMTDAPGIDCHGTEHYLRHGIIGAEMLRSEGVDEHIARVAERHTGTGLTADDIVAHNLPLPPGDYMPQTQLERLVCYADKFFSKSGDMQQKSLERVRSSMKKISDESLARFEKLHQEFS